MSVWTPGLLIFQIIFIVVEVCAVVLLVWLWTRAKRETLWEIQRTAHSLAQHTEMLVDAMREETDRRAADLREQTKQIAEEVKQEALARTEVTASELDKKIDALLQRFDRVELRQQDVKQAIEETKNVIHRELVQGDDHTARAVIEDTHQITSEIDKQLKKNGNGDPKP